MLEIDIQIDHSSWRSGIIPRCLQRLGNTQSFDKTELLLHVADATKNPIYLGRSLNDYWAFLRYNICFEDSGNLRLVEAYEEVDPHQKTILSDDIGMGMASLIMERSFGIRALTPTSFFLKYFNSLTSIGSNRRGPNKSPDFIVLDDRFDIHIVECKGTQSGISTSDNQINDGRNQKVSLSDPHSIVSERLVIGTFIAKATGRNNSRVKIVDPEFKYDFSYLNKEQLKYQILLAQFIKELSFVLDGKLQNEIFPQRKLEDYVYFQKLKSNLIESNLMQEKYEKVSLFGNLKVERKFDLPNIKKKLLDSTDMEIFLNNFIDNNRKIKGNIYKGIFGLEIKIS